MGVDNSKNHTLLRPPAQSFESNDTTPPPITNEVAEASSYHGLIESGGRPVCSIQDLSHLLAEPTTSYERLLPWLSGRPDSEIGSGEIKTVFSRQFTRWWEFRKSQWNNRGNGDGDEGFSAFFEATRNQYEGMGAYELASSSSFEETIRRQWQRKPTSRQLPDGQTFPAYREAIKRRLTPYHFTRPMQLKKDPRQQSEWTTWLEYLNYEQWWSERLTAAAESREEQNRQAWERLLETRRREAALGSSQTRRRRPGGRTVDLAKELEAARAELDATNKMIDDFIRETARYRRAETAAYYQKHRVKWAVKEARLMETEMSQQHRMAKSNTKVDTKKNKKRRRGDSEEIRPEPRPKRAKRGDGGKSALSDTTLGKPQARRSSKRLAKLKDKAPP